jgi:YfiR/HmsC-like
MTIPIGRARRWCRLFCAVVTTMTLSWPARSYAQTATAAELTSAYLYNFAKFTEWPSETLVQGERIAMCVVGDSAVADALGQTVKGRAIEGHELTVALVKADASFRACHLLYVSGLDEKRSLQLIESVKAAPVLTASDAAGFAERGGVAQFILEDGHMRFAINVAAAQRARLQLSSKLLSLARIIKDEQHVQH